MAQGTLKSKKLTTATAKSSTRRPGVLGPKKGSRTIAPRNQVLVRNAKMTKVCYVFLWHRLSGRCVYCCWRWRLEASGFDLEGKEREELEGQRRRER